MSQTEKPLSVAEVLEIEPSENSWVNEGVHGVVQDITPDVAKTGKKYWKCILRDSVNGAARIGFSLFFAPKFQVGDAIEIVGQGIKRKEFNGRPDLGIGVKAEIHVTGRGAPPPQERGNSRQAPPPDTHGDRGAPPDGPGPGSTPPAAGNGFFPHGQTVGMAMKEAIALVTRDMAAGPLLAAMGTPLFWSHVHMAASDIIRVSHLIERGQLAPSVKVRGASSGSGPKSPPPSTPPPQRTPPHASQENLDEDVPF